jgi:hypothetical protein
VASAPNRDLQIVLAREAHGRDDIGAPDASRYQARSPIDRAVPHCTSGVVVAVFGSDEPSPEPVDL